MASSSGSDSDDSDGLDLDLTPEDMQAIMDAEERLEKNVYDYDGQAQVRRGRVHAAWASLVLAQLHPGPAPVGATPGRKMLTSAPNPSYPDCSTSRS